MSVQTQSVQLKASDFASDQDVLVCSVRSRVVVQGVSALETVLLGVFLIRDDECDSAPWASWLPELVAYRTGVTILLHSHISRYVAS